MRLQFFFFVIVLYVLAAFGWLTYSLINFSNNEYQLKNQVLKAGKQDCVLNLIESVRRGELNSVYNDTFYLRDLQLVADTLKVKRFIQERYGFNYAGLFFQNGPKTLLEVNISTSKRIKLEQERENQKRIYLFESLLLALLVGVGVYGVYYSVRMIYNLNKQQNNFLLSVTHELKTPIATVKLLLQTMLKRELPPEMLKQMLENALENTERLNDLTVNMLTAMQIENERYTYDQVLFSLSEMLEKTCNNFAIKADLTTEIEPNIDYYGDPFIIRMAVNNLIENAIKYSNAAPVFVKLSKLNQFCLIEVADQGIGVGKKDAKRIFKKFYRVQDEEVRDTKGTGLGLFIVKESLRKQKAKVWVESNQPKGSRFFIRLKCDDNRKFN